MAKILYALLLPALAVSAQRNEADIQAQQSIYNQYSSLWYSSAVTDYKYHYSELDCANCYSMNYPWSTIVSTSPQYPQVKAIDSKAINRGPSAKKVEDIYAIIQLAMAPQASGGAEALKVDYDLTYGYPTRTTIIWVRGVNEQVITMTGFEKRTGPPEVEYANGKALWESQRIYDYSFKYWDYGPNPQNIQWPLTVSVRNRAVVETRDKNGNLVTFYTPPTMDGFLAIIERALQMNAPYVDAYYSKRGFPEGDLQILTTTVLHYRLYEWNYL